MLTERAETKDTRAENGRNYGIDVLRLLSAFFAIILHVMGQGGVNDGVQGLNRYVAYLIYVPAYCAVNCFAIISGYVGYGRQRRGHRCAKYMLVWLQVEFYNLLWESLFWIANPARFGLRSLIKALMPVTYNAYWYFTAYTGVFLLAPWLNLLVEKCDGASLRKLMLTVFLVFSGYVTLVSQISDPFLLGGGYSFLWLMLLYIVGAWMKREAIPERVSGRRAALCGVILVLCTWLSRFLIAALQAGCAGGGGKDYQYILLGYCSPTTLGLAIVFTICFSKLRMRRGLEAAVRFLSPAAFGIYLAHMQYLVFHYILKDRFRAIAGAAAWQLPLLVWGAALVIFAAGLILDKAREGLFRLLRLRRLCEGIEACARRAASRFLAGRGN